jgi:peptidoglycan/xylan/chitin deacetylase (PgdA/CDA1 family)
MVIAVLAGSVAIWSAVLVLQLGALDKRRASSGTTTPHVVAELVHDGRSARLEVRGTPGAAAVIFSRGEPVAVLTLDRRGRALVTDPEFEINETLEIAALAGPPGTVSSAPGLASKGTQTRAVPLIPTVADGPMVVTTGVAATPTMTSTAPSTAPPSRTQTAGTALKTSRIKTPVIVKPLRSAGSRADAKPGASPPILHLVTDGGSRIAVTFDGNASSNGTAGLLNLLKELDMKITLFVTGGFIERHPTLVRRAVLSGHEVGNHTYSHPHLTTYPENRRHRLLPKVTKAWFQDQLRRTEVAFRRATGRPMAPLWRAPYGEENRTLRGWALELGYLHVRWSSLEGESLDSRDWVADEHSPMYQNSRRMMDRLLGFPRLEGGIVLMHLATERSEPPWAELPRFVEELGRRSVIPVKVSDLLENSSTWRPWFERARTRHEEVFPPGATVGDQ